MTEKRPHRSDRGYPDLEPLGDGQYWLHIPIPHDVDRSDDNDRAACHDGGTVSIHLTENQVNEWVNKLSETLAKDNQG